MQVAEQIARFFVERGVTHAFGIVGGANLVLFEAMARHLTVISVLHEQAAAMSANYYTRTCGRIAPVLVTNGGGTMNALTGVTEAFMDGIPMLVISGNEQLRFAKHSPLTRTIGFQGVPTCAIVERIVKKCVAVDNALGAKHALESLYRKALEARQGACWLDLAQDVAAAEAE